MQLVLTYKYDHAWNFSNGSARVRVGELYGLITKEGKELVPIECDLIEQSIYERFVIQKEGKYGLIDTSGASIVAAEFDELQIIDGFALRVSRNDKMAYLKIENGEYIWKEDEFK